MFQTDTLKTLLLPYAIELSHFFPLVPASITSITVEDPSVVRVILFFCHGFGPPFRLSLLNPLEKFLRPFFFPAVDEYICPYLKAFLVPCSNFAFGLTFINITQQLSRFFCWVLFASGARESSKIRVSLLLRNTGRFVDELANERKHSFNASSDLFIAAVSFCALPCLWS